MGSVEVDGTTVQHCVQYHRGGKGTGEHESSEPVSGSTCVLSSADVGESCQHLLVCVQPPEQLQERMQAMAAAIKQEEALQVDALHRQRLMEKRLQEIGKVRSLHPANLKGRAC